MTAASNIQLSSGNREFLFSWKRHMLKFAWCRETEKGETLSFFENGTCLLQHSLLSICPQKDKFWKWFWFARLKPRDNTLFYFKCDSRKTKCGFDGKKKFPRPDPLRRKISERSSREKRSARKNFPTMLSTESQDEIEKKGFVALSEHESVNCWHSHQPRRNCCEKNRICVGVVRFVCVIKSIFEESFCSHSRQLTKCREERTLFSRTKP